MAGQASGPALFRGRTSRPDVCFTQSGSSTSEQEGVSSGCCIAIALTAPERVLLLSLHPKAEHGNWPSGASKKASNYGTPQEAFQAGTLRMLNTSLFQHDFCVGMGGSSNRVKNHRCRLNHLRDGDIKLLSYFFSNVPF